MRKREKHTHKERAKHTQTIERRRDTNRYNRHSHTHSHAFRNLHTEKKERLSQAVQHNAQANKMTQMHTRQTR